MSKPRAKQLWWGPPGVKKTRGGMGLPGVLVIDTEDGTQWYREEFPGATVIRMVSWDEFVEKVDWLRTNKHDFRTLHIDGITTLKSDLDSKWIDTFMRRNQKSPGYKMEYYTLQPADYKPIGVEFERLLRKLTMLDMNVIITARSKTAYEPGEMMKAIGLTFDGPKQLPYWADTVLYLFRSPDGKFMAKVNAGDLAENPFKDRAYVFPCPQAFEFTDDLMGKLFGDGITRPSVPTVLATAEQVEELKTLAVMLQLDEKKIKRSLAEYSVESYDELTETNAAALIERMDKAKPKGTTDDSKL
jgi:hypothetical protein